MFESMTNERLNEIQDMNKWMKKETNKEGMKEKERGQENEKRTIDNTIKI